VRLPFRPRFLAPVFLLALLLGGCGEATWNPELKAGAPLDRGTPFVEALDRHGCPDSIQEIDSDTFTASWEQTRLIATTFSTERDTGSLAYMFRKGKVSGLKAPADKREPARGANPLAALPLAAVLLAWLVGRSLREKARVARLPLLALSVALLATTRGGEKTGVSAEGGGVPDQSPVGLLVDELGAPSAVLRLPGETGALLVYRRGETKRAILGGSESVSTQAFFVQRGKVVKRSLKTTTLQAQYFIAPFHETVESAGLRPPGDSLRAFAALLGWSCAFATLALALTARAPRKTGVESPRPPS
jgi:hypothetical protein